MKIKSVKIENLRSFKQETIPFDDYTCLVGPNGAGKSTVICALNIFFRESGNASTDLLNLQEEDFHNKNIAEPIRVTVVFYDLSAEAQEDFKDYFRQGELVVSAEATYDAKSKTAAVKQYGQRNAMKVFAPFFEALGDGKPVKELKVIYETLRKTVTELPAPGTKDAMTDSLRAHETNHPEQCELIPSEDEFYGVSKGANRLAKYLQWVFVPAVKDAASEQTEAKNTALGRLLARTVRSKVNFTEAIDALRAKTQESYEKLLAEKQGALTDLSTALCKRLADWAHPDALLKLAWRQDQDKSVRVEDPLAEIIAGEGGFEGSLARFGHGLQRSYLLVLLQELASSDDTNSPRLVLGCEEPELYQHPPQARHLAEVLQKLSLQNTQVIICTHSPYFVTGQNFESVRMVRKPRGTTASRVAFVKMDKFSASLAKALGEAKPAAPAGVLAKIHQELQPAINEIFFTPALVLVEGLEDVAYITTYLHLTDTWKEYRRLGCHIVPAGGKHHIVQPLAVTGELGIPTFVVFDSDAHEPKAENRVKHEKDNKAILTLCDSPAAATMPADNFWSTRCVMWKSEIGEVVKQDFDPNELEVFMGKARLHCGQVRGLDKNALFIADYLTEAWNAGKKSPTLEKLCAEIITFAKKATV